MVRAPQEIQTLAPLGDFEDKDISGSSLILEQPLWGREHNIVEKDQFYSQITDFEKLTHCFKSQISGLGNGLKISTTREDGYKNYIIK